MSSSVPAVSAVSLGKRYTIRTTSESKFGYGSLRDEVTSLLRRDRRVQSDFWALRNATFDISTGERVGIIGRNGAGKSTLLKLLARVSRPTSGHAVIVGRLGALLEVGTGFHPELSGRDNVRLAAAVLGMGRREVNRKLDQIIEFAEVQKFAATPVKRYSSGMYMRLAFSVAAHLEPEVLVVDEVLAVGDAEFQRKCLGRMQELGSSGRTVVFVSHSMDSVSRLCDRAILLENGLIVKDGPTSKVIEHYIGSGAGAASRLWEWDSQPTADSVRPLECSVLSDGKVTADVQIDQPTGIRVRYHAPRGLSSPVRPALSLYGAGGVHLFDVVDFESPGVAEGGEVETTCIIPPNLLAEGRHSIRLRLMQLEPNRIFFEDADVVAFTVFDQTDGNGTRGTYRGDWSGVVRPKLSWSA